MAEHDNIIPNTHTQRLYQSLNGNKQLWELKGVGHNNWTDRMSEGQWQEVVVFLLP